MPLSLLQMQSRVTLGLDPAELSVRVRRLFRCCGPFLLSLSYAYGQATAPPTVTAPSAGDASGIDPAASQKTFDKRAFGFVPNYNTADASAPYQPITPKQKMTIAAKDSFDWTLSLVAAGYAGLGQLTNQNPSFGQGLKGYGNRFVRGYSDQILGNMIVEGAMPILTREDPRYFRRGQGTFWSRVGYATSRVIVTRTDRGGTEFNYSEIVGNSIAVGISDQYYPGSRSLGDNFQKFTFQLATDAATNVLKEFWPDVKHKLFRHPGTNDTPPGVK
jgi:hypothetical protein